MEVGDRLGKFLDEYVQPELQHTLGFEQVLLSYLAVNKIGPVELVNGFDTVLMGVTWGYLLLQKR